MSGDAHSVFEASAGTADGERQFVSICGKNDDSTEENRGPGL